LLLVGGGGVRVRALSSPPGEVVEESWLCADAPRGGGRAVRFAGGGRAGEFWLVRLEGVQDRDAAAAWALREVAVPRSALPPPAPGEYYLDDLPGLEAVTLGGKVLGRVSHLVDTPANTVMVVVTPANEEGKPGEIWVPVVRQHVRAVSLDAGQVTVDWEEE